MAFAPSQPENSGEHEFNLLADEVERMRLFNEELDLRAERMDRRARDIAHAMEMRAAELDAREELLWNEQERFRAEKESAKASLLSERREFEEYAHHLQMATRETERAQLESYEARCANLNQREGVLRKEQETYNMERKLMTRANLELAGRWHDLLERERLQRGREAELALWQSELEGREDELATAQAQLSEEREAFERRARDEVGSSPVSPPPEGDF